MSDSWTCLMVQNGPGVLSDGVRTALKIMACRLKERNLEEMRFQTDIICGHIKTEWKTHLVGTRSGVLFKAHIDCQDGNDYRVNFLISNADLEKGKNLLLQMEEESSSHWEMYSWRIPIPQLYQFEDLAGPSRMLQ